MKNDSYQDLCDEIRKQVDSFDVIVGTTLTLNGYTRTCCDITEDRYGIRYIFNDGIGWTKSNIVSNIVKCIKDGNEWQLK